MIFVPQCFLRSCGGKVGQEDIHILHFLISLNYFAPFIFLNLFLFLLIKPFKKYFYILGFILLFIATRFSEAFGVANILFLTFLT